MSGEKSFRRQCLTKGCIRRIDKIIRWFYNSYCIQEFFILKKYRGRGLAREAINELFKMYKGMYCLLILERNINALKFWRRLHESNNIKNDEGVTELGGSRYYYHVFKI